jgi:hypothetical protein
VLRGPQFQPAPHRFRRLARPVFGIARFGVWRRRALLLVRKSPGKNKPSTTKWINAQLSLYEAIVSHPALYQAANGQR